VDYVPKFSAAVLALQQMSASQLWWVVCGVCSMRLF